MRAKQTRSLFIIVLVAGVAAISGLWTFSSTANKEQVAPEFGGVYIEGIAGSPARVNPLFARENATDQSLVSLVFAGLTRLDTQGSPFPDMAQTWHVSPDGLTYTFLLRPNLVWHDGVPVTADDVLFTYRLLQSPDLPIPPRLSEVLADATVEAADSQTVVITLDQPYSPLPAFLTLGILPQHLLDGLSLNDVYNSFFNQQPVGSGAYRLVRLTPVGAEFAANPAYHLDQPFIQRLEVRFYRDEGALTAALKRREVTAALLSGGVTEADGLDGELGQELRFIQVDTGEITYVYLNLTQPMFQDRRVRQALLYAIDRDAIVMEALDGQARKAESPIRPASWAHSASMARYGSDRALASLLLDDAGWRLEDDGVRRRDGEPLAFTLITNNDLVRTVVAHRLAAAWNDLGLEVRVVALGVSDLVRNHMEPRNYEAAIWAHVSQPDPDPYEQWHSSQATGAGANLTGFASARVDSILEEGRIANQPRRKELYREFQEIFAQEVPAIPLYVSTGSYGQESRLLGVRVALLTQPGDRFWQVQEWFVKTR